MLISSAFTRGQHGGGHAFADLDAFDGVDCSSSLRPDRVELAIEPDAAKAAGTPRAVILDDRANDESLTCADVRYAASRQRFGVGHQNGILFDLTQSKRISVVLLPGPSAPCNR